MPEQWESHGERRAPTPPERPPVFDAFAERERLFVEIDRRCEEEPVFGYVALSRVMEHSVEDGIALAERLYIQPKIPLSVCRSDMYVKHTALFKEMSAVLRRYPADAMRRADVNRLRSAQFEILRDGRQWWGNPESIPDIEAGRNNPFSSSPMLPAEFSGRERDICARIDAYYAQLLHARAKASPEGLLKARDVPPEALEKLLEESPGERVALPQLTRMEHALRGDYHAPEIRKILERQLPSFIRSVNTDPSRIAELHAEAEQRYPKKYRDGNAVLAAVEKGKLDPLMLPWLQERFETFCDLAGPDLAQKIRFGTYLPEDEIDEICDKLGIYDPDAMHEIERARCRVEKTVAQVGAKSGDKLLKQEIRASVAARTGDTRRLTFVRNPESGPLEARFEAGPAASEPVEIPHVPDSNISLDIHTFEKQEYDLHQFQIKSDDIHAVIPIGGVPVILEADAIRLTKNYFTPLSGTADFPSSVDVERMLPGAHIIGEPKVIGGAMWALYRKPSDEVVLVNLSDRTIKPYAGVPTPFRDVFTANGELRDVGGVPVAVLQTKPGGTWIVQRGDQRWSMGKHPPSSVADDGNGNILAIDSGPNFRVLERWSDSDTGEIERFPDAKWIGCATTIRGKPACAIERDGKYCIWVKGEGEIAELPGKPTELTDVGGKPAAIVAEISPRMFRLWWDGELQKNRSGNLLEGFGIHNLTDIGGKPAVVVRLSMVSPIAEFVFRDGEWMPPEYDPAGTYCTTITPNVTDRTVHVMVSVQDGKDLTVYQKTFPMGTAEGEPKPADTALPDVPALFEAEREKLGLLDVLSRMPELLSRIDRMHRERRAATDPEIAKDLDKEWEWEVKEALGDIDDALSPYRLDPNRTLKDELRDAIASIAPKLVGRDKQGKPVYDRVYSRGVIDTLNRGLREDPRIAAALIDTIPATADPTDDAAVERIVFKLFPELAWAHEREGLSGFLKRWRDWLPRGEFPFAIPEPTAEGYLTPMGSEALNDGDPRDPHPQEVLRFRDPLPPGTFLTTNILGRYDPDHRTWAPLGFAFPPRREEPTREVTAELPRLPNSPAVMLPTVLGGAIIGERVHGIGARHSEQGEESRDRVRTGSLVAVAPRDDGGVGFRDDAGREIPLDTVTDHAGRTVARLPKDTSIDRIAYSQEIPEVLPALTDVDERTWRRMEQEMSPEIREELRALLGQLPPELDAFVAGIRDRPRRERVEMIEAYVRRIGYYDFDNREVQALKRDTSFTERLRIMRERMEELRERHPELAEQLRGKVFAGVCADHNLLTAALLRRAGIPAGILTGFRPHGTSVTTANAHATAFVPWPDAHGKPMIVPVDGTPSGTTPEERELLHAVQLPGLAERSQRQEDAIRIAAAAANERLAELLAIARGTNADAIRNLSNGELERLTNTILRAETRAFHVDALRAVLDTARYAPPEVRAGWASHDPIARAAFQQWMASAVESAWREATHAPEAAVQPAGSTLITFLRESAERLRRDPEFRDGSAAYAALQAIIDASRDHLSTAEHRMATAVLTYLRAKRMVSGSET